MSLIQQRPPLSHEEEYRYAKLAHGMVWLGLAHRPRHPAGGTCRRGRAGAGRRFRTVNPTPKGAPGRRRFHFRRRLPFRGSDCDHLAEVIAQPAGERPPSPH